MSIGFVNVVNKLLVYKPWIVYEWTGFGTIEYTFFNLKIINPQNIDKNILEISDQNRINIEVTLIFFNQSAKNTK